jgi:hypothetical protein
MAERRGDQGAPDSSDAPCAACGKPVRPQDAKVCPICRRRVCVACLRPYGHHMRVCEECRLAEW